MKKIVLFFVLITCFVACKNPTASVSTNVSDTLKTDTSTQNHQKFGVICLYDSISTEFNYQLSGYEPTGDENDKNDISLSIFSKKNKQLVQTISFEKAAPFHYDCASYSFITGYHSIDTISDGIYGDVVTADFNFDGQEDFAVAFEVGYSEFYLFYLQENGKFVKNNYLTDSVGLIPEIDTVNKTLTTWTRLGVTRVGVQKFGYNYEKKEYSLLDAHVEGDDDNNNDDVDVSDEEEK